MRRPAFVALLAFVLTSCAPKVSPVADLPPNARTIAIVPAVPPFFRLETLGFLEFGNHVDDVPDQDWHLDTVAYQAVRAELEPRYQVFEARPRSWLDDPSNRLDYWMGVGTTIGSLVRHFVHPSVQPDLYVVLIPSARAEPYIGKRVSPIMVGLWRQNVEPALFQQPPLLHTFLEVAVLDGKTFHSLYQTPLLAPAGPRTRMAFNASKSIHIGAWHDRWSRLSDEQRQKIETETRALLRRSIVYTLSRMSMGGGKVPST